MVLGKLIRNCGRGKEMTVEVVKETVAGEEICKLLPVGRLDTLTSPELEKVVLEQAEECRADGRNMVMDLSGVDYISSAGLRVIVQAHREMGGENRFVLCGLTKNVRTIINMTGFNKKLNIRE